jgi:hypothetical protein
MELALGLLGLLNYDKVMLNNNRNGYNKLGLIRSSRLNFCCVVFDLLLSVSKPRCTMRENN